MTFGATPTTSTEGTLPTNQIFLSSVAVPNTANGDLTALEGGPASTDSNNNKTAPASMYVKDGGDVAQGLTTDTAVTGDNAGTISAKLRGLTKIFADVWDSVNHLFKVADIEQASYIAATSPPSATNVGSDTTYTFSSQVNRIIIQNNTSVNLNYSFDSTASAGSLLLVPGAMLVYPKKVTVVHLFTASAQNINGTTSNNLVVLGAL